MQSSASYSSQHWQRRLLERGDRIGSVSQGLFDSRLQEKSDHGCFQQRVFDQGQDWSLSRPGLFQINAALVTQPRIFLSGPWQHWSQAESAMRSVSGPVAKLARI